MKVDWDNIKYIFQLPLKWYSWIDTKIRHMYGADFINIKHNGYNDGIEVGVDYDSFANEVRKIAGQPEDGWVKSVDNNYPDEFGDVRTNSIKGIDSGSQTYYPDERGIVSVPFSSTVQSVDNVGPDTTGNIQLGAVRSVNGEYFPDESGNIFLPFDGTVKSVDNIQPDSNGNVSLGALTILDIANQGSTAGPSYKGDKPVSPMSHNHNIDEVLGVKNQDGTYNFVKSINTQLKPDSNGNINLNLPDVPAGNFLVASVDGIRPSDLSGDVKLGAVRSIKVGDTAQDILKPDENGQIDLGKIDGSVKTVNYVEPDDDGNIDLGNLVYTVNDIEPDSSGNIAVTTDNLPGMTNYPTIVQVNTNIISSLQPITEKLENLTHDDITDWSTATAAFLDTLDVETAGMTVGLDYVSDRFVCNVNHGHKLDDITDWDDNIKDKLDDDFVTLDTEQTITGQKEFKSTLAVQSLDTSTGVQLQTAGIINIKGNTPAIAFFDKNDSRSDASITLDVGNQRLEFNSQNNDMLIGTSSTDMHVSLIAPQNNAVVNNPPSDDCPVTNAIATVGWVRKNAGGVKSVNGITPDANGNIEIETGDGTVKSVNGNTPDANGNVFIQVGDGTVKSVDNVLPDSNGNVDLGALTSMDVETAGQIVGLDYESERYVCNVNHGHKGEDVGGMTAGKWVKTDSEGYLTTTTDTPVSLPEGVFPASDGPSTFLVGVASQNTTTATFSRAQLYFTRGIATKYTALENQSIRVPQIPANVNPPTYFEYVYDADWDGTSIFMHRYRMNTSGGALIGGQYLADKVLTIGGSSSGYSGTVPVVTGVTWDGTKLVISTGNMTVTNGVITAYAAGATSNIDTVTYP